MGGRSDGLGVWRRKREGLGRETLPGSEGGLERMPFEGAIYRQVRKGRALAKCTGPNCAGEGRRLSTLLFPRENERGGHGEADACKGQSPRPFHSACI